MSAKCGKLHEILSLHFMWLLGQFRVACAAWVDEDRTESQRVKFGSGGLEERCDG